MNARDIEGEQAPLAEDEVNALFEKARSGEANDPRRVDALLQLQFIVARQRLRESAAAERTAVKQLEVAVRQSRSAFWTAVATGSLVLATLLLVVATAVLVHVSTK